MKIDDLLAKKFDLSSDKMASRFVKKEPVKKDIIKVETAAVVDTTDILETDTTKSRTTISSLIDKSVSALDDLIRVARESENPRAYEVVSQMLKVTADMSKDLLAIQKLKKDIQPNSSEDSGAKNTRIGTQQNIFVGTTNDLHKAISIANGSKDTVIEAEIEHAED